MDIGVGLDATLGLSFDEQGEMSQEAARLGYASVWTPENVAHDSFQLCAQRWVASRQVVPEGLTTGIAVSPVLYRTPVAYAMSGGSLSQLTGGRFILGIGSGGAYRPRTRRSLGLPRMSSLSLMRDYLTTIKGLVSGETVDYQGEVVTLRGVRLNIDPPPNTPVYLGTLGPEMLRLAGELADGVCLNWCTPEQIAWSRDRIAEGAERVGRNPAEVKVMEYIRVCVDEDEDLARQAFAKATMGYALGQQVPSERERQLAYRGHFERMGFAEELLELDEMRKRGESDAAVAAAFTPDLLRQVGYYGSAAGAAASFQKLAQGLDIAIVRVVAARPGTDSVLNTIRACQPA